jgi:AbrB family looped-hinge helix DNA binding protein
LGFHDRRKQFAFSDWTTTETLMQLRKEFLHKMSTDNPEITTVTSKGQITIPSELREEFGLEKGAKLVVVPTDYGLVLKKLELPSVEEFQQRVEKRSDEVDLSMDDVNELVHDARDAHE